MASKTKNQKLTTKNYLITGGAGFLGYHLTKQILKTKNQKLKANVTILDIAPQPQDKIYQQTTYIQGDVRNLHDITKAIKGINIIIHAAAALPLSSPQDILTTTIDGTRNILDSALKQQLKTNSQKLRTIYISSTAVYGVPNKHPIFEADPLIGIGPYGHAKIAAEKICEEYRKKGLTVSIVRPKTFIGTERLGVFQILCNWIREGHKIPIIGNGKNKYQLLDVEDLVTAILLLATLPTTKNQKLKTKNLNSTFNVGAEKFSTVNNDVGALCEFAQSGSKPLPIPSLLIKPILRTLEAFNLSPLYRWVYDTADKDSYVSIDKLKSLGWQPKYSNSDALIKMYKWYMEHYQKIEKESGTTHRVGWNQGALGLIKKFL